MNSLLAVITLVLGLAFPQARAFADLPDAKTENLNLVAGRQAIKAKDFKSAVKSLTNAVQENPNDADAHTMLGYSYRKLGTFDKSLEHYQMAFEERCQSSKRAGISWRALPRHESTCQCRETTPGAEKVLSLHRQMRGVRRPESSNQKPQTEVVYIGYLGELRLIGTKLSVKDASPPYALRGDTWKMIRRP